MHYGNKVCRQSDALHNVLLGLTIKRNLNIHITIGLTKRAMSVVNRSRVAMMECKLDARMEFINSASERDPYGTGTGRVEEWRNWGKIHSWSMENRRRFEEDTDLCLLSVSSLIIISLLLSWYTKENGVHRWLHFFKWASFTSCLYTVYCIHT